MNSMFNKNVLSYKLSEVFFFAEYLWLMLNTKGVGLFIYWNNV